MRPTHLTRLLAITVCAITWGVLNANALMQWNEGKDQVYVTGSVAVVLDSNIYTSADSPSDTVTTANFGMEYRRQAGLIGVNADLGLTRGWFSANPSENYSNPDARVELTKDTGRTTGTVSFHAMRSSRADPAANVRTDSWNYGTELNARYPVSDRHHLTGSFGWNKRDYVDNTALVDLTTSMLSADWFYVYTPERDLFGGYRLRMSETSVLTTFADHSFSVGISGRILPKLNGTARAGYQVRNGLKGSSETFTGYNALASVTWNVTRKVNLRLTGSKDFSTTSTNITTDTTSLSLDAQYARTAKLSFGAGVSTGLNKFLGELGGGREDMFFSYYGMIRYTFSERLRLGLNYTYYQNWSTLNFADFERRSLTFDASTRF
jgi:hypothetical protein